MIVSVLARALQAGISIKLMSVVNGISAIAQDNRKARMIKETAE